MWVSCGNHAHARVVWRGGGGGGHGGGRRRRWRRRRNKRTQNNTRASGAAATGGRGGADAAVGAAADAAAAAGRAQRRGAAPRRAAAGEMHSRAALGAAQRFALWAAMGESLRPHSFSMLRHGKTLHNTAARRVRACSQSSCAQHDRRERARTSSIRRFIITNAS